LYWTPPFQDVVEVTLNRLLPGVEVLVHSERVVSATTRSFTHAFSPSSLFMCIETPPS
jgi:hypothetical protein